MKGTFTSHNFFNSNVDSFLKIDLTKGLTVRER